VTWFLSAKNAPSRPASASHYSLWIEVENRCYIRSARCTKFRVASSLRHGHHWIARGARAGHTPRLLSATTGIVKEGSIRLERSGIWGDGMKLGFAIGLIAMSVLLAAEPAAADRRVALVAGNSAYQHISMLANPTNDARLMAETLRTIGFTLVGGAALIDLDKSSFDDAVQKFGNQIVGADVALFYYAGHGVQVRGGNHLVPINANPTKEADVDFQMVDVSLVLRQMEGSGTRLNLVILDACRNNPFGGRGLRSSVGGLAQMSAPEGTIISYATQPGNVAQDGVDGDSPYTKALAQTLRRPGLGIFDVFNEVGLAVKRSTAGSQQPWVSSSPIDGNFYFVPPSGAPERLPASAAPSWATEAAQAWSATKDTTNTAVPEAFIQRYRNTFYADLAGARLEDLRQAAKSRHELPPSRLLEGRAKICLA
jgi:uncharacterized caspase-like protein